MTFSHFSKDFIRPVSGGTVLSGERVSCTKSTYADESQRNSYKVNFSSNEVNHFRKTVNFTSEEGQQKQYRKTLALKIV